MFFNYVAYVIKYINLLRLAFCWTFQLAYFHFFGCIVTTLRYRHIENTSKAEDVIFEQKRSEHYQAIGSLQTKCAVFRFEPGHMMYELGYDFQCTPV